MTLKGLILVLKGRVVRWGTSKNLENLSRISNDGSVMVSSPLLPAFGTLSLLLYFRLPSTFLPSKGRSVTTLGTRWHDFVFIILFRYFINYFILFITLLFLFLRDAESRKGTLYTFCVPIHKKKMKKISVVHPINFHYLLQLCLSLRFHLTLCWADDAPVSRPRNLRKPADDATKHHFKNPYTFHRY